MSVTISSDERLITKTIDDFREDYHQDYHRVRPLGMHYLASSVVIQATVSQLAISLRSVLQNWGAGKRSAPALKPYGDFVKTLSSDHIHRYLADLSGYSVHKMRVVNGQRLFVGHQSNSDLFSSFDTVLIWCLNNLAQGLFIDANTATYPTKTILLITGLMPAFDSQVRKGLHRGGFAGMSETSFLLSRDASSTNCKKLSRLPFLLGECWEQNNKLIRAAARRSNHPDLENEPGRIFDILLFMQAKNNSPILVSYEPRGLHWYDID